jgi:hypothetical protein
LSSRRRSWFGVAGAAVFFVTDLTEVVGNCVTSGGGKAYLGKLGHFPILLHVVYILPWKGPFQDQKEKTLDDQYAKVNYSSKGTESQCSERWYYIIVLLEEMRYAYLCIRVQRSIGLLFIMSS